MNPPLGQDLTQLAFRNFEVILLRESYIKKLFTLAYRLDYSTFSVSKKCNSV